MKHSKKGLCMLATVALFSQCLASANGVNAVAKPKLSTKSVKVNVNATKKVTVKNAKGYKITVKSKKATIATAKKKGNNAFVVKGIKAGKTTITCLAKKGKKEVTLKCSVTVSNAATKSSEAPTSVPATEAPTSVPATVVPTSTPATAAPTNAPATEAPTDVPTETPYVYVAPEPIDIELQTDVPDAYRETAAAASEKGSLEDITYETETYDEDGSVKMIKDAFVYLPAGYDESKKYNVLYLMHGGGENEKTWLIQNDYTGNKKMVDNLIANGVIDPLIIVTPTFYREKGAPKINDNNLPAQFQYELRKDLIPYVESHYSTYAGGDVSEENLIKTRMHRAFAGLSMGSMTTYRSALYANYDMFAWFGPFSGCQGPGGNQEAEVDKIVSTIENGIANGMPLGFLYCGNGVKDMAHDEHLAIMQKAVEKTDKLVEGANYAFVDLPYVPRANGYVGEHSMWSWHIHLYNCLRVFFTRE